MVAEEERNPARYLVDWGDGDRSPVKLGHQFKKAIYGSPRYLQFADPDGLARLLTDSPVEVFLMALAEAGTPQTATKLRDVVTSYGIPEAQVAATWKQVRRSFEADSLVITSSSKLSTYNLRGDYPRYPDYPGTPVFDGVARDELKLKAKPTIASIPAGSSGVAVEAGVRHEWGEVSPVAVANPDQGDNIKDHAAKVLAEVAGGVEPSEALVSALLLRPLSASHELLLAPKKVISEALVVADGDLGSTLYPFLASMQPGAVLRVTDGFKQWFTTDQAAATFDRAIGEYSKAFGRNETLFGGGLALIAERLVSWANGGLVPMARWIDWLVALAKKAPNDSVRGDAVDQFVKLMRIAPQDFVLSSTEARRLAKSVSDLPFKRNGGRSALLASIARVQPEILSSPGWWVGLDFTDLADAGDGPLGLALRLPAVRGAQVVPKILSNVSAIESRRPIGRLLSASTLVAEHVEPTDLAAAFQRAAESDSRVQQWLDALRNRAELESAQFEVAELRAAAADNEREVAALRSEKSELARKVDGIAEQLRAAGNQAAGLRSQERRQIQIDSMRALARLALMIQNEVEKLDADALIGRTRAFVNRQGLIAIGEPGEETEFNPVVHESPSESPPSGSRVIVVRPGYTWRSEGEELPLQKAVVMKIDDRAAHG